MSSFSVIIGSNLVDMLLDGDWQLWITTGSEDRMAFAGCVYITAYGDKGTSDIVTLGTGRDDCYFKSGAVNEIKVNLGSEIGEIYKVRLWAAEEEEERSNGWFLEKV